MPDRTVFLELDVSPEVARQHIIPIVIAGSSSGSADARKLYRAALADLPGVLKRSDEYYREFAGRTLRVHTPDPVIDSAFDAAKFALEKGWQCNEGVGCGLVAGFAPSGASERPGFAWYFGGDALMNSWSILDYGDPARTRALLEFLRDRQREDGKIMHELTQSAALLDWSKYPYGYYHGDTTALYMYSVERYARRTGDLEFLRASWPSLEKAYRFYLTAVDTDGLISNRRAGMAAVETGALSGKVEKDVYLQGAWLAALGAYARAAAALKQDAADASARLTVARDALLKWFVGPRGFFAFGRLADGTYDALSSWQAFALGPGGLTGPEATRAAASLNRPELSTDWGTRLFATDSPSYDPLSYNDGSVWPFVTGFVTAAEYRHHLPEAGFQHLRATAALTGLPGAGFIPEYLSGDRAQALPRAVPHQLFSSSAVVHPLVSGLLGLDGDALAGTLTFAPHLPPHWPRATFEGYRVGRSVVSGSVERKHGEMRIALRVEGEPLRIVLSPAFPAGSEVTSAGARIERSATDVHAITELAPGRAANAIYAVREGVAWLPDAIVTEPGDRSRAVRLLSMQTSETLITFELCGPGGTGYKPRFWSGEWRAESASETIQFPPNAVFSTVRVSFRNSRLR
jgi:glycogen debranching enzyme